METTRDRIARRESILRCMPGWRAKGAILVCDTLGDEKLCRPFRAHLCCGLIPGPLAQAYELRPVGAEEGMLPNESRTPAGSPSVPYYCLTPHSRVYLTTRLGEGIAR